MNKDKNQAAPKSQDKDQDNIGYDNTTRRTDRDDKEMDRLPTTDTGDEESASTTNPKNADKKKT